jgi:non-specific serine/threonine protein kinase
MAKELAAADDPVQRQGVVLGSLLRLKQICNHPSLFSGDAVYDAADSGKFGRLAEICQEIASRGERVLVFTQFREMTGPLAAHLESVWGVPGLVLHGGTPVVQRQQLVERFQAAGGPPFFVISVKAGGTGLTLTAASHVIHFDRWWNPAVEDQATDRAYRIGQTRPVMVHKFICEGTLEERIDYLIGDKKRLATEVLEDRDGSAGMLLAMSDEELLGMVQLQRRPD